VNSPEPNQLAEYSLAFDRLVDGDDDTIGLLAYALFKKAIREDAQRGVAITAAARNPAPTVVRTYRHAAESIFGDAVERSLTANLVELQQSAALDAINTSTIDLKAHIDSRTNFGSALLTSVFAWIVTLAITVLIIWLIGAPDPARVIADNAKSGVAALSRSNLHR
jgi:hypothetical protein